MYSLANTLANVDSEGRFDIELTFAIDIYMNEHETWGLGVGGRDPRKQIDFCTNVKKRQKTKSHMSVGRIGLLQHYWYKVPVLHIMKYHFMSAR